MNSNLKTALTISFVIIYALAFLFTCVDIFEHSYPSKQEICNQPNTRWALFVPAKPIVCWLSEPIHKADREALKPYDGN